MIARRSPIVSRDIARTPTFELGLITETDDERASARGILGNGLPVLLRTPPDQGIGNLYFSVLGFTEQRIVKQGGGRLTAASRSARCRSTGRTRRLYLPLAPATYAYVKATFATYAALDGGPRQL